MWLLLSVSKHRKKSNFGFLSFSFSNLLEYQATAGKFVGFIEPKTLEEGRMKPHLTKDLELKEESKTTLFMQWLVQISGLEPPFSRQVLRAVLFCFSCSRKLATPASASASVALRQDARSVDKPVQ